MRIAVPIVCTTAVLAVLALACGTGAASDPAPSPAPSRADLLASGEAAFLSFCSGCHGVGAVGSDVGPPLVHVLYESGHHPDWSIENAVANGVRSHHWNFGDMPPVEGITDDEVSLIICYVRELQRAAGVDQQGCIEGN